MQNNNSKFILSWELRLCEVNGEIGYFHCWEHYSNPSQASVLVGGAPEGVFSKIFGIVEFSSGVRRVDSCEIKFCDEMNAMLHEWNRMWKGDTGESE